MRRSWVVAFAAVILASFWLSPALVAKDNIVVTFKDSCHCIKCHAAYRWDVKTDDEELPAHVTPTKMTPSKIGAWNGPGGIFDSDTPRKAKENRWYELTGRVSLVKIESDGDLHIQLVDKDATDDDINVVVEVPFGEPWCDIRKEVFTWFKRDFPFKTTGGIKFTLQRKPFISVVGKAFYDAIHGGGDTSNNRRPVPKGAAPTTKHVAIWEIHPVMKLTVVSE